MVGGEGGCDGDPAGVGAEIALKALADRELLDVAEWVVIGDHAALEAAVAGYRENVDPRIRFVMAGALDPAKPIRIVVVNGNVTLTGVVDSKMDRDIAGIRANTVPGVFKVVNDLQVAAPQTGK